MTERDKRIAEIRAQVAAGKLDEDEAGIWIAKYRSR
jgi:hypothetical protein